MLIAHHRQMQHTLVSKEVGGGNAPSKQIPNSSYKQRSFCGTVVCAGPFVAQTRAMLAESTGCTVGSAQEHVDWLHAWLSARALKQAVRHIFGECENGFGTPSGKTPNATQERTDQSLGVPPSPKKASTCVFIFSLTKY